MSAVDVPSVLTGVTWFGGEVRSAEIPIRVRRMQLKLDSGIHSFQTDGLSW